MPPPFPSCAEVRYGLFPIARRADVRIPPSLPPLISRYLTPPSMFPNGRRRIPVAADIRITTNQKNNWNEDVDRLSCCALAR